MEKVSFELIVSSEGVMDDASTAFLVH